MSDDWITTSEAAQIAGYREYHIRRLIGAGKIYAEKRGRDWWVSKSSLEQYIREIQSLGDKRGPKTGN